MEVQAAERQVRRAPRRARKGRRVDRPVQGSGDVAMQYSPEHVALPWAAFRFLLTVACGDAQVFGSMVLTLEVVARLATRCRVLEELYLRRPCDSSGVIEEALVRLYADSLALLAQIIRFFKKSTGGKISTQSLLESLG
jgi:hypothetical protein